MIDPQPGVSRLRVSKVVPEREDWLARVPRAQRIGPALRRQPLKGLPDFGDGTTHPCAGVSAYRCPAPWARRCNPPPARRAASSLSSVAACWSGARTSAACSQTSVRVADCRWEGTNIRRLRRRPPPRYIGCACRSGRPAAPRLVSVGSSPFCRIATPFQLSDHSRLSHSRRREAAPRELYPEAPSVLEGRRRPVKVSRSQRNRTGKRPFTPLTLKVAIFIRNDDHASGYSVDPYTRRCSR